MQQFIKYPQRLIIGITLSMWSWTAAAAEITAIDFQGKTLGQVISTGMVINGDGENIGYMTADSLIKDNDDTIIGGVVPQGVAMGIDNRLLGKVHTDGVVRSLSGRDLGKTLPNGLIVNPNSEIIGQVLYPGLVYSNEGQTIGRLTGAGTYTNLDGQEIGFISADGYAYRQSANGYVLDGRLMAAKMVVSLTGRFIGSVAPSGKVVDFTNNEIGIIHANGYVYDAAGKIIGGIVNAAYAFDTKGDYMGVVSYNGEVTEDDSVIGYYRPDGNIVNEADEVIGYAVPMTSTATDYRGRYLGYLSIDGEILHGNDVVGHLGANGYVYDDDDALIGELVQKGPIFNVLAQLKGMAAANGAVISLGGSNIGKMKGAMAFDGNGTLIGASLRKMIAIGNNNLSLGSVEFDATIKNGAEIQKVSPFGYLLSNEQKVIGKGQNLGAVYGLEGNIYSYISPNGTLYRQNTESILTPNGVLLNKDNWLGATINPLYALSLNGQNLGKRYQNNLIENTDTSEFYKITPGNYVIVANSNEAGNNLSPIYGFSSNKRIALSISGDLLGYADATGSVQDLNGNIIGRIIYRDYVLDNNGIISGQLVPFASAGNDKCNVIGAINGRGDIINNRDVLIGRILPNGQAISDSGSYVGYAVFNQGLIDFNGKFVGTANSGQGVDVEGRTLGCISRQGQIFDSENKMRYGVITPEPVINFENKIIGHIMANGQAVDPNDQIFGYQQPNGNVVSKSKRELGNVFKYAVAYNNKNNFMGMVQNSGQVIDATGTIVGKVNFDGSVVYDDKVVGYALYDFYVYDENFATYGYLTKDGTVLSMVGSRLGKIDKGFVVDKNKHIVARGNRDYIVRDINNTAVGTLNIDGKVYDFDGKNIGQLDNTGAIIGSDKEEIAHATPLQYYIPQEDEADWADTKRTQQKSNIKPKAPDSVIGGDSKQSEDYSRRIVGIALSPDGDVIGNIYDDDSVKDDGGNLIGYRTPDGIIVDTNYNPIGIEEVKRAAANNIFMPANAVGNGNPYGIGSQPSNLGPGGGYGQGERYDPVREQALAQLQAQRRGDISVGKISSGISTSSFTGYEEDGWPGTSRNISSWRVDMSQMILEDKPIPAVLARSVYASEGFSDNVPITAIVERNIYAEEGRNIIIPAGSRVIGRLGGGSTGGNSGGAVKIGITWKRLIRPDGSQFLFSQANTADAQGRAGAIGYLDEQLLKRYTMPLLTTALESGLAYAMAKGKGTTNYNNGNSTEDARSQAAEEARQNFIAQMNNIFEEILQRKANIRSVTYVPAGTRIIIFPNEDMWLNDEKREKEKQSSSQEMVKAPLIETSGRSAGGSSNVTYDGNYTENVRPVSAENNQQNRSNSTLIDNSAQGSKVPPASIQQAPASATTSSGATDDVPDLF
ncbi:MAG: TrbI/VirB10 family protein [Alphaproteobacteria bacterium]|nr:TrbI/VirB10 family protein [Alphaproteobacteria bacterium]